MGAIKKMAKGMIVSLCAFCMFFTFLFGYNLMMQDIEERNQYNSVWAKTSYTIPEVDMERRVFMYNYANPLTYQDFLVDAQIRSKTMIERLDLSYQTSKLLTKLQTGYNLSDEHQLYYFLKSNEYGVCRHKSSLGFWLLNSEKDVWIVAGFYNRKYESVDFYPGLDMNHNWLARIDRYGEEDIIDLSLGEDSQEDGYYKSYAYIGLKGSTKPKNCRIVEVYNDALLICINEDALLNQYNCKHTDFCQDENMPWSK